jgi:hypothetical protein
MVYIPDPIERGEMRAKSWADENIVGDKFKCACGEWCDLDDGNAVDSDLYSPPFCQKCCEEAYKAIKKANKKKEKE